MTPPLPGMKAEGEGGSVSDETTGRLAFESVGPVPVVARGSSVGWWVGAGRPRTGAPRVAVFPGSRRAEIDGHMPAMLEVLSEIKGRFAAGELSSRPRPRRNGRGRYAIICGGPILRWTSEWRHADAIIRWADLVLIKSGTGTMQVARHGKPMVVMYAVPWWQWQFARHFIHTRYISIVNILAGRELVPEFIPFHGSPLPVARACIELLTRGDLRSKMSRELEQLMAVMAPAKGKLAAERVAEEVVKLMQ